MSDIKKYSEMNFEEFMTDVLNLKLTEEQKHLVRLFDENKTKKVEYINTYPTCRDIFPNNPLTTSPIYCTSNNQTEGRPMAIDDLKL